MNETDARLDAYLDGELDATESRRFEAELGDDLSLRSRYELRKGALDLFRGSAREAPPRNFAWLVQQRIRRRVRGPGARLVRLGRLGTAVEVVIAAVMVVVLGIASLALSPAFEPPGVEAPARTDLPANVRDWLLGFGEIESVGLVASGADRVVRLALRPERWSALQVALPAAAPLWLVRAPDEYNRVEIMVPNGADLTGVGSQPEEPLPFIYFQF